MGLFNRDYESHGSGVAKNEPQKRAVFRFFDLFLGKFWVLIWLNMIYVLFCLPIVTVGPATAALTAVCRKMTIDKHVFIFYDFVKEFKRNFKQAFFIGIADLVIIASLACSLLFLMSDSDSIMFGASVGVTLVALMMHFYIYLQIAALSLPMKAILKNSFFLAGLGLKINMVTLVLVCALIMPVVYFFPFTIVIVPFVPFSWVSLIVCFNSYPIVKKHIIDPYYARTGEQNPEEDETDTADNTLFTDMGGKETPRKASSKRRSGKVIK